jgi:hypothetical protein
MRRAALATFALGAALALLAVVWVAAGDERGASFSLEVESRRVVAVAAPGEEACQRGLEAEADFDVVEVLLGTYGRPGPPLAVSVRRSGSASTLARGRLAAGARDNASARVRLDRTVDDGERVDVCTRNEGERRVAFYGGLIFDVPSRASVASRPAGDLVLGFHRSEPRSMLSLVPEVPERAAVLRPDPVGPWTFWILLAAMALGVPLLLGFAVRAALRD